MPFVFDDEAKPVTRESGKLEPKRSNRVGSFVFDDLMPERNQPGAFDAPISETKRTWSEAATDTAIDVAKGVVGWGESVVGITDLATGNLSGKGWGELGFNPDQTRQILSDFYSDARKQANSNVSEAHGFVDKMKALLENPSVVAGFMAESAPMMLGSVAAVRTAAAKMLAAKGLAAGSAEAGALLSQPAVIARLTAIGSAAEGAMATGSIQEQGRQEGRSYGDTAPSAVAGGALTALIGVGSSKIPGFRDAEVGAALAGMGQSERRGVIAAGKEVAKGMFKEGVLEELPQSAQEQVFTNLALGKPWDEGVGDAAAQGMVAGAGMGGGMHTYEAGRNALSRSVNPSAVPPDVLPMEPGTERAVVVPPAAPESGADQADTSGHVVRPEARLAELEVQSSLRPLNASEVAEAQSLLAKLQDPEAGKPEVLSAAAQTAAQSNTQEPTPGPAEIAPKKLPTNFWDFVTLRGYTPGAVRPGSEIWSQLKGEYAAAQSAIQPAEGTMATTPVEDLAGLDHSTPAGPENAAPVEQIPESRPDVAKPIAPPAMQDLALQNRDRSRTASVLQMAGIAAKPDYMRLGTSRTPDSGAPMVFAMGDDTSKIPATNLGRKDIAVMADGQRVPFRYAVMEADQVEPSNFADGGANPSFGSIEPGTIKALNNGRAAGLRAAYEQGNAANYRAEMIQDAEAHGVPSSAVEAMKAPVLVRLYSQANNVENMAAKSQGQGLGLSAGELARQDAPLMDATVLTLYRTGDVGRAANQDFVRAFVGKLQQSGQDIAGLLTAQGDLSPNGRTRIQAALVQAAYGDADLVQEMFDSQDTDIKAIGEALKVMAGPWANMRDSVQMGVVDAQMDITGNLVEAVNLIRKSRHGQIALSELANQTDLITGEVPDPLTTGLLRFFYRGEKFLSIPLGKEKVIAKLDAYVQAAMSTSAQTGMFGDEVTVDDILATITTNGENHERTPTKESGIEPSGSSSPRGDPAQRGSEGRELLDEESRSGPGGDSQGQREDATGQISPSNEATAQGDEAPTLKGEAPRPPTNEDVGQQLYANRRNFTGRGIQWNDVAELNDTLKLKEVTKAKVWPRPNYEKLVTDGMPALLARMVKQVYDSLSAGPTLKTGTPPTDADLKLYIDTMAKLRDGLLGFVNDRKAVSDFASAMLAMIKGSKAMVGPIVVTDMLNQSVDAKAISETLLRRIWPEEFQGAMRPFVRGSRANGEVGILGGNKALAAMQFTRQDFNKWATDLGKGWPGKREAWQVQGYRVLSPGEFTTHGAVRGERSTRLTINPKEGRGSWVVNLDDSKLGKEVFVLVQDGGFGAKAFDTREQAIEAAREKVKRAPGTGQDIRGTNIEDAERTGPARRQDGEDISSQHLMDTFGFRGVNFGREDWINQAERQAYLNQAYDGLVDLAEILGVPAEAMSLDGKLGIAFGAQGKGKFAAHFVPGVNEINLTKTRGAGTLAHEWGHALDHYFATQAGLDKDTEPMLSEHANKGDKTSRVVFQDGKYVNQKDVSTFGDGIRPDIVRAFRSIYESMTKRNESIGEAKMRRDGAVDKARKNVDSWLSAARRAIQNSVAENKADLLSEFDQHAEKFRQGDVGDGFEQSGKKAFSSRVAAVRNLIKDATGRLWSTDETKGLDANARYLSSLIGKQEADSMHEPQKVSTQFKRDSLAVDKEKGGKAYWSTPTEMFARAFELYIHDKLSQSGSRNTFLTDADERASKPVTVADNSSAMARGSSATRELYVYPVGAERETLRNAFDSLVGQLKTRETDNGVALYQQNEEGYSENNDPTEQPDDRPESARNIGLLERGVARAPGGAGADSVHPYVARLLPGHEQIGQVAAAFGDTIQGFGLRSDLSAEQRRQFGFFNGAYLKGTIYLRDVGQDRPHLSILGHEMSHRMAATEPELYAKLVQAIEPFIDRQRYDSEFRGSSVARNVSSEKGIHEEFIGEVLSDGFMEKKFWRAIGDSNPSLLEKVRDFIGGLIDTIKSAVGYNRRTARILSDFDRVMEIAGEVMGEYGAKRTAEADAPASGPASNRADDTDTDNFREWFGDSKVVDADGKPLVMYHGTTKLFNEFKSGPGVAVVNDSAQRVLGFFFTNQPDYADVSITHPEIPDAYADGAQVMPVYLSLRNPKIEDMGMIEDIEMNWTLKKAQAYRARLESQGYDGIIFRDDESRAAEYVAFLPEQIKSAIGNNGNFDPANPDIRFNRNSLGDDPVPPVTGEQANAWNIAKAKVMNLTSPAVIDKLIYEFQDKYIDLKRLREHIAALGGTITDLNDAYLGEELYHQRLAKRTQDFLADELKPLLADMRARGITLAAFEEYLHARHAPEANAELAKHNPSRGEIDSRQTKARRQVETLTADLERARRTGTATKAIEESLALAREEYARWQGAQAFKGDEDKRSALSGMSDAQAKAIIDALTPGKKLQMEALAKQVDAINSKTLDMLQTYGLMDRTSLSAWRSQYHFYVPLHRDEAHADTGNHPVGQGFSVKGSAAKGRVGSNEKVTNILGHIAMQREAALTRGEKNNVVKKLYVLAAQNPDPELWELDKPPTIKTVDSSTGFVRTSVDPGYKNRPNVLMVRIAGKDAAIVFNEHNPRAVRLASAMKNLDVGDLHVVLGLAAKGTRWFASVNTQYNPIFGIINFARDLQEGLVNLSTTAIKGKQLEVAKGVAAAMRAVYRESRGKGPANAESKEWIALWNDLQETGGVTGYRDLYADAGERVRALESELKALDRGEFSKAAHAVVDWLSDYNEAMENSVRLSAYKVAIDSGLSKERAASLAKNLTVNFNRKGRQTREIGALYAFFNAAIQGTARMAETLTGPMGRRIMLGGVVLGAVNALVGMALMGGGDGEDDEWDKIPDFIKERSLIIPLGRHDYLTLPMPLGFKLFPNIGRLAVEFSAGGNNQTVGKLVGKLLSALVDTFNPLGGAQNLGQIAAPTVIDPVVALMQNRDWTGKQIYRENANGLDPQPGHKLTKDSASTVGKGLSKAINAITGGTEYRPGAWSPTPDQIDYVFGQLTGGLGRELLKVNQTVSATATGDELPPYKIPLVGRLYGNTRGQAGQSERFYENVKAINEVENELTGRSRNHGDVKAFREEEPLTKLIGLGKQSERVISQMRHNRRVLVERSDPGHQAQVKEIDTRIGQIMANLNREVDKVHNPQQKR